MTVERQTILDAWSARWLLSMEYPKWKTRAIDGSRQGGVCLKVTLLTRSASVNEAVILTANNTGRIVVR
uniref:Transposase n=1 Tax=Ascaris lumbricoides TaxID=6252 RepID=A0A0M3HWS9_ASCLU